MYTDENPSGFPRYAPAAALCAGNEKELDPLDGADLDGINGSDGLFILYNSAFENLTDEEIAQLAQSDDEMALEYLLGKYKNFVRAKARSYFLIGASHEDIVQEGMIGLFKAVRDYRQDKLSTFRAFAELCVTRQIITAIKTATRQKHIPLNSYISLNKPVFDEESDRTLLDLITEVRVTNPEDLVIGREEFIKMEGQIGTILSRLEQEVLLAYLDGHSYQRIAHDLSRHVKSIDNALQRVKRKMEKLLEEKTQAAQ